MPLDDLALLVAGALGIALVSLTDTISTASAFAARRGEDVDGDREMIGIGAANVAAGLFQGFPGLHQRIPHRGRRAERRQDPGHRAGRRGARSPLMLLFVPGLLRNLPQPTLAAIVIAASLSLADLPGLRRLWRQRPSDFWLAMAAFLGVALLGVLPGIAIAVALSVLDVFNRAWRPVPGRPRPRAGPRRATTTPAAIPDAELLPGLVIYRFDGAAVLRQRPHVPRRHPAPGEAEPAADVDRRRRRADHRHRHHRRRHARSTST